MTTTKTIKKPILWVCAAAIAVLLLAVGVWGGMYYANHVQIDSIISLDVNPSLEITANKRDTVLEVRAVNADARAVLDGMELKGVNLQTAVNAIIGSMLRQGYLNSGENEILVTVQNGDPAKVQKLQSLIDTSLQNSHIHVPVTTGTVENDAEAEALAEREQISVGKASYILELTAADPSLDVSALAAMSVKELNELKNGTAAEPEQPQPDNDTTSSPSTSSSAPTTSEPQAAQSSTITLEQAKQIALQHAGLSADQVTFIKAHLDWEDGIRVYEIEFWSGNTEYDYEINARTGAIHSVDWDIENFVIPSSGNSGNTGNAGGSGTSTTITLEKAKEIALNHAGLSAGQVTFIKAKLDYEDGIRVYEIEFWSGNTEYDYEINAQTGAIHSVDWDVENFSIPNRGNTGNSGTNAAITVEKAKQIALQHAGLSASAVGYIEVDMDYEHGVLVYEIEFKQGRWEYEYEIDANTGKILEFDKDWDD